jgi:predicted acyltransferase
MFQVLQQDRLASLDAFRGLTIAGMILVNSPGSWKHIYPALRHAQWHGWTPTDLVFPFFLFILGVTTAFSLSRRDIPSDRGQTYRHILRRSAILFGLGLLLALYPHFDFGSLRVAGVLQRIAIVYAATALILLHVSRRNQFRLAAGLLLGYWVLMELAPVPGVGAGVLTPKGNFAAWVDRALVPGRLYRGSWDPEGLFSTLPALATALLGSFTAYWMRSGRERTEIAAGMFAAGWIALLGGLAWGTVFPINKNLWTSSYVLFTAGLALEGLALCYWLIDIRGYRRWARPAISYGLNPITAYVLSMLLATTLRLFPEGASVQQRSFDALSTVLSPENASLAYALGFVVLFWAFAALLERRRIFIKV